MTAAQLRVWPAITRATIAPELYGHQIEMVGQSVYEGIWTGRASRISNEEGLRTDVLAILKHLRVPVLKWPGDAFANYYHWQDGIGTGKAREQRVNIPWQATEPNTFGTHEFLLLCEKVGCKPWITCNSGTGSAGEALSWLEYCTFGGETAWTKARTENGNPEPFDVPYWSLAGKAGATGLRALNPDILDVATELPLAPGLHSAPSGYTPPRFVAFSHALATHGGSNFGERAYRASFLALRRFEVALARHIASVDAYYSPRKIKTAIAAWGVRHPEANPESGMEQPSTLRDALLAASVLNLLNEQAARVGLACIGEAINAGHCLVKTKGRDMFLTPTYHVYDMMSPHKGGKLVFRELESPKMAVPRDRDADVSSVPALNVSVSRTRKRLCITVTNQSYSERIPLAVEIREAEIASLSGRVLTANAATAENSFEAPKTVSPARIELTPDGNTFQYDLPPHAFATFLVGLK